MTTFLTTLGWGFAALLAVAAVVALWEHGRARARTPRALPPPEPRRAASLDVDLDHVPAGLSPLTGDQAQRAAALDVALGRMGMPPGAAVRNTGRAWTETEPMVAASLQVELPSAHPADGPRA
jgi:hypothetical protein